MSEDSATYRQLADLLLRQNRAAEAQEVMDLMSIQEAQEFLGETSATRQRLQLQPPEQTILDEFQNFVQSMRELEQLKQIPEDKRTPEQTQRISELEAEKSKKARGFNRFRAGVDIYLQRLLRKDLEAISLNLLNNFQCFLPQSASQRQLQPNVAVLRPLVLNDRLELVLTIPAIRSLPPRNYPISVPADVLNQEVNTFRQALVTRDPQVKQSAQKLYQRLIQPIESTLQQAGVKTIVYGADEELRYVPLAALHDGKQWLVQKYRTFSIINSSLANCNAPTRARTNILAGAGTFQTPVGLKQDTPTPLPFAKQEVETIAALFPQTTTLIDRRFNRETTRQLMNQYNILHFATHATFFPRNPKDSYILFGNGDRDTLIDISQWNLQNTDLIVLSACETAVNGK